MKRPVFTLTYNTEILLEGSRKILVIRGSFKAEI